MSVTTLVNRSKDQVIQVHCASCGRETNHLVLQSIDKRLTERVPDGYEISWLDVFQILECRGCETTSFRQASSFSEAPEEGESERLYPQRSRNSIVAKSFNNLPPTLRRLYRETIDAFNFEAVTLCAGGLRAIVEGICAEQGVTDGPVRIEKNGTTAIERRTNLQAKIAGLHERGMLTEANADTLHEHRFLGNEALHELAQPSPNELRLAVQIIEHTLEALYEIPETAAELRGIRLRRRGGANAP